MEPFYYGNLHSCPEVRNIVIYFQIENLQVADDGSYQCVASNDAINSTFNTAITGAFR